MSACMSKQLLENELNSESLLIRDTAFWLKTWQDEQQYGFHEQQVNPLLARFWPTINTLSGGRVLVPLCGKTLDMLWLAEQGFQVIGVELSPIAVKAFYKENGLKAKKKRIGNFVRWSSGSITIWCGDFFALSKQKIGKIDAVFDRAALSAMPEDSQEIYLQQLLALLNRDTCLLLLTLEDIEEHAPKARQAIDPALKLLCSERFAVRLLHSEIASGFEQQSASLLTVHARAYMLRAAQS